MNQNQFWAESIFTERIQNMIRKDWLKGTVFIELIPVDLSEGEDFSQLRNNHYVIIGTCHVIQNSNFGFDGRGGFKGGFCGLFSFFGGFSGIFGGRTGWKLKTESFEVGLAIGVVSFFGIGGGTLEPNISSVDLNIWIFVKKWENCRVNRQTLNVSC